MNNHSIIGQVATKIKEKYRETLTLVWLVFYQSTNLQRQTKAQEHDAMALSPQVVAISQEWLVKWLRQ
jgi:hypothetical protein